MPWIRLSTVTPYRLTEDVVLDGRPLDEGTRLLRFATHPVEDPNGSLGLIGMCEGAGFVVLDGPRAGEVATHWSCPNDDRPLPARKFEPSLRVAERDTVIDRLGLPYRGDDDPSLLAWQAAETRGRHPRVIELEGHLRFGGELDDCGRAVVGRWLANSYMLEVCEGCRDRYADAWQTYEDGPGGAWVGCECACGHVAGAPLGEMDRDGRHLRCRICVAEGHPDRWRTPASFAEDPRVPAAIRADLASGVRRGAVR